MRVACVLCVVIAIASSVPVHADVVEHPFSSATAPEEWHQEADASTLQLQAGRLVSTGRAKWRRDVDLAGARGWAMELEYAASWTRPDGFVSLVAVDDVQSVSLYLDSTGLNLGGDRPKVQHGDGVHVIRIEVHGGRWRLKLDGKQVFDRDRELDRLSSIPRGVTLVGDGATVTWRRLTIDTAPRGLVRTRQWIPAVVEIPEGPFASTWRQLAQATPGIEAGLATLVLRDAAAPCVAATLLGVPLRRSVLEAEIQRLADAPQQPICTPARAGDCGTDPKGGARRVSGFRPDPSEDERTALELLLAGLDDPRAAKANAHRAIELAFRARTSFGPGAKLVRALGTLHRNPRACTKGSVRSAAVLR